MRPFARACPWPRKVDVMKSPSRRAAQTPTAVASCPWHWWIVPGIEPSRKRNFTPSSNSRIRTMPLVKLAERRRAVQIGEG